MFRFILAPLVFISTAIVASAQPPTVEQIISGYEANQRRLEKSHVVLVTEQVMDLNLGQYGGDGRFTSFSSQQYFKSGENFHIISEQWGDCRARRVFRPETAKAMTSWMWNGKDFYTYTYALEQNGPQSIIIYTMPDKAEIRRGGFKFYPDAILRGYIGDEQEYVVDLLGNHRATVEVDPANPTLAKVSISSGPKSYVIVFNMEKGCNIVDAAIEEVVPTGVGARKSYRLAHVELAQFDGTWLPAQAEVSNLSAYNNGMHDKTYQKLKRESVAFDPDFEQLGAFAPNEVLASTDVYDSVGKKRGKFADLGGPPATP